MGRKGNDVEGMDDSNEGFVAHFFGSTKLNW